MRSPHLDDGDVRLYLGDCVEVMDEMEPESVDAIVCDPPYGLDFMNKHWDTGAVAFSVGTWIAALRVLKPGGHLLAFGGTRTFHRLTCGIEDAGFEIRDCLSWLYGSGFPKGVDVSKAIDRARDDSSHIKAVTSFIAANRGGKTYDDIDSHFGFNGMAWHWITQGAQATVPTWDQWERLREFCGFGDDMDAEVWRLNGRKGQPGENWFKRELTGRGKSGIANKDEGRRDKLGASKAVEFDITAPATDAAKQWQGWGTALKPAWEPVVVARKPLIGTVAENVTAHGTGALNVDGCRIGPNPGYRSPNGPGGNSFTVAGGPDGRRTHPVESSLGRWPANVTLDEAAAGMLDAQSGKLTTSAPGSVIKRQTSAGASGNGGAAYGAENRASGAVMVAYGDTGGASRFFYTAKASRADRNTSGADNTHPTVKPTELMRWLVRLVTPPDGVVLDPFAGSGTTLVAARAEGFRAIGIEKEEEYAQIIAHRLSQLSLFADGAA